MIVPITASPASFMSKPMTTCPINREFLRPCVDPCSPCASPISYHPFHVDENFFAVLFITEAVDTAAPGVVLSCAYLQIHPLSGPFQESSCTSRRMWGEVHVKPWTCRGPKVLMYVVQLHS